MIIRNTEIELIKGDITKVEVDIIVNAANSSLLGGGGVDGAIHRTGGKQILDECMQIRNRQGKCNPGEAVYTSAGFLPAKYVIHTVGPVWNGGHYNESTILSSCYRNSLILADSLNVKSIAFPCISTGVYRFPKREAAEIAVDTVKKIVEENEQYILTHVYFVCFDDESYSIYKHLI